MADLHRLSVFEFSKWREEGRVFELIDVRTETEREIARIEGARLLDEAEAERVTALPRDTTLVFQCHHGVRSRAAAMYFLGLGFENVYNLEGGIEAWSRDVDPEVPRY